MQSAEKIGITMTPEQLRAVRGSVAVGSTPRPARFCATRCGSGSAKRMLRA
ncbi:hypothetical protein FHU13_000502 [Methylobacterium sp. R2-1]|nr:hypothetical protein [Methylobacterium sp. R2-1]